MAMDIQMRAEASESQEKTMVPKRPGVRMAGVLLRLGVPEQGLPETGVLRAGGRGGSKEGLGKQDEDFNAFLFHPRPFSVASE